MCPSPPRAEHGADQQVGDVEREGGAVAVAVAHDVAHLVVDGDHEAALDAVPVERVGGRMSRAELRASNVFPLKKHSWCLWCGPRIV